MQGPAPADSVAPEEPTPAPTAPADDATSPTDDAASEPAEPPPDAVEPPVESSAEPAPAEPTEPAAAPVEPMPAADAPATGVPTTVPSAGSRFGLRRHRFVYKNLTALRFNPLGAVNEFQFGYRLQLVNRNTALFKESYLALKVHTFLNPAFGRIGPMLEIQPLAILNLQAIYNGVGYFRTFDQLQSFQSPNAIYSDDALDERTDSRYATTGHYITLRRCCRRRSGASRCATT